ncbi:MAG: DUF4863 family protein [Rhodocyclaceae bacterium]|nr:DUF4863 family protein [Rhodocyclaceae bacterium]
MSVENFVALVSQVTGAIDGMAVDKQLEAELNRRFPADGEVFQRIAAACREGVAEGWMCRHEQGGIRFGRVAKPGPALHGFSIDVVEMGDVVGPHHEHPRGEVDMVMPIDADARFDGAGAGWFVYGPGSAHRPTVAGGKAHVLYLLPGGEIRFTGQ